MFPAMPTLARDTACPLAGAKPGWLHSMLRLALERLIGTVSPERITESLRSLVTRHFAPSTTLPVDVMVSIFTFCVVPCVTDAQPVRIDRTPVQAHRPQNRHPAPRICDALFL
ncbi:hypothetical protein C4F17_22685 [Variovorax sp. PMC12]|nr:hypothetical protein C4F17_22685 [Variovorax sp. PMC12]